MNPMDERIKDILDNLHKIQCSIDELRGKQAVREHYTCREFANLFGLDEWTVRNYCRLGRIRGQKKKSGRGLSFEWAISHAELLRFRGEGLLPPGEGGEAA